MKVHIFRTRMAMDGRHYAYDGLVELVTDGRSDWRGHKAGCTTICKGSKRYISFVDATRPEELDQMPLGWDRYQAALAHERLAQARLLRLAQAVYPELGKLDYWPELWVSVPELAASHAEREVEVY